MRKFALKFTSILLIVLLFLFSVISASAELVYYNDGFYYRLSEDEGGLYIRGYDKEDETDVVIPRGYLEYSIAGIDNYAFENNSTMESISFENAYELDEISSGAFAGCTALKSVVISNAIKDIGAGIFKGCTSLETVEFYGNGEYLPAETFYKCSSLKNVRLSAYLTGIGNLAFAECKELEVVEIPKTVTSIGKSVFRDCPNLTVRCFTDSAAHNYCKKNNIPFYLIDGINYELGDVTLDGEVNIDDVTAIQRHLAQIDLFNDLQLSVADVDGSGEVSVNDATRLQRLLAGFTD